MTRDPIILRSHRLAVGLIFFIVPWSLRAGMIERLASEENLSTFKQNIQNAQPENWKQLIKTYQVPAQTLTARSLNRAVGIHRMVKLLRTSEKNLESAHRSLSQAKAILQLAADAEISEKMTKRIDGIRQKTNAFGTETSEAESAYLGLVGTLNQRLILRWREHFAELAAAKAGAELNHQGRWKEDPARWAEAETVCKDLKTFHQTFSESVIQATKNASRLYSTLMSANTRLSGSRAYLDRELKQIRTLSFVQNALIDLQADMLKKSEKSRPDAEQAIDKYYDIRSAMAATSQAQATYEAKRDALKRGMGFTLPDAFDRMLEPAKSSAKTE